MPAGHVLDCRLCAGLVWPVSFFAVGSVGHFGHGVLPGCSICVAVAPGFPFFVCMCCSFLFSPFLPSQKGGRCLQCSGCYSACPFQVIMPTVKCVFSREGRQCSHDFSSDGHSLCVPHRPCVSADFVFDPEVCGVCGENVKFLRTLGYVDRLSQHFTSIRKSWEAVQRSAKRKGHSASWSDPALREFLLGRGSRRSSASASSSADRASSSPSTSEPLPPPSSVASAPPPASPTVPHLSPPTPPPPPPTAPASPPPPPPSGPVTPQVEDLLRTLVAQLGASRPPAPTTPPVRPAAAPSSPLLPDPSPGPSAPLPDSPPFYGVDASPVSEDEDAPEPPTPQLPRGWAPVPPTWEVVQQGDQWVLQVPDPSAADAMAVAPNKQVRWGTSRHSPSPRWHFRLTDLPPRAPASIPSPAIEELANAFDSLGLWAGLSPPVLSPDGPEATHRHVDLAWMQGQAMPFLRPLRDWWPEAAVKAQPSPPPRVASRARAHVMPLGSDWDAAVGRFLLSRPPTIPPPLSSPSAEVRRVAERDKALSLESFSGLSALLALEALMRQMSTKEDLATLVTPSLLCEYFLPMLHGALLQLAPSVSADLGRALSSQLALWKQATASLPPAAQTALLAADPCAPDFTSSRAVADALSRAPQVHVVYQGLPTPRGGLSRGGKSAPPPRFKAPPPSSARRPHRQDQRLPYPARSSRPPPPGDRYSRPARDSATSSRRPAERPFRAASSSGPRGTRH